MSKERIKQLQKLIQKYNKAYYDDSRPLVTDAEYDELKREYNFLLLHEEQSGLSLFQNLQQVGYAPNQRFKIIKHKVPMLSIDNVNNEEEFFNYLKKVKRFLNIDENDKILFTCELKIDGLSFSARYEKGQLVHVITRGDGVEGEDVTLNVKQIVDFPQKIDLDIDVFEVRGEIYISKEDFIKMNENLEEKDKFSNPRNAASGTLRNLDISLIRERNLRYFTYTFGEVDRKQLNINSQFEFLNLLKRLKFNVNEDRIISDDLNEIKQYYDKIFNYRYKILFDIDGIVIKVDNLDFQDRLGSTNHSLRWAIAYKFPAQEVITKIIDVYHQIGRTGILTPVAILQPVNIGGVLIRKATMHNYDDINKKNLSIGSVVFIKRAGDVIPYIVKNCNENLTPEELNYLRKIEIPSNCPCCNSKIFIDRTSNVIEAKCLNKKNCKEQIIQSISHFTSRDAMNIKGLGEKIIERFYNIGFLKKFSDIWGIEKFKDQIINLDGFGEKSYNLLINSILERKEVIFSKFLYSIGIEGVGAVNAAKIAQFFGKIESFTNCLSNLQRLHEELDKIDGIGTEVAFSVVKYFEDLENIDEFIRLTKILIILEEKLEKNLPFFGKSIVFTGQISISRQEAKSLAQKNGFKVLSSVSKNLDFLVAGDDAGSKLKEAQTLGVKVLNEQEWLLLIREY